MSAPCHWESGELSPRRKRPDPRFSGLLYAQLTLMKNLTTAIFLLPILSAAAVYAKDCTLTEEQWLADELPRLKSWSALYASYKAYTPECDDGFIGEGYSDAVVKLLSGRWAALDELAQLAREDPAFRRFAVRHVDATVDVADLRKVLTNATR